MAGFKFRLEKILEHREILENIKKGEFGKIQAKLQFEVDELARLFEVRKTLAKDKELESVNSTTMSELQKYNKYMENLKITIELQEEKIEAIKLEVEKVREALIQSTKDKKIIEKLKQRDYEEYLYEEKKEEEKITDQFVSYSSSTNAMED